VAEFFRLLIWLFRVLIASFRVEICGFHLETLTFPLLFASFHPEICEKKVACLNNRQKSAKSNGKLRVSSLETAESGVRSEDQPGNLEKEG
jgi:hypothetical protein